MKHTELKTSKYQRESIQRYSFLLLYGLLILFFLQDAELFSQVTKSNIWCDSGRLMYRVAHTQRERRRAGSYLSDHNQAWPADFRKSRGIYNSRGSAWVLETIGFVHPWTGQGGVGVLSTALGEAYPGDQLKYIRYPYPVVTVDGVEAGQYDDPDNILDPSMNADQVGWCKTYSQLGICSEMTGYTWSHPDYQDLTIVHFKLYNTGEWRFAFQGLDSNLVVNDWPQIWIMRDAVFEPGSIASNGENRWANWNFWWDEADPSSMLMYGFDTDRPDTPQEDEGEWTESSNIFLYPQYTGWGYLHLDHSPTDKTNDPSMVQYWGHESWPTLQREDPIAYENFLTAPSRGEDPEDYMPDKRVIRDSDTGGDDRFPDGTDDNKLRFWLGPYSLSIGDTLNWWVCYVAGGLDPHTAAVEGTKWGAKFQKGSNGGKGWSDEDIAAKNEMLRSKGVGDMIANYQKAKAIFANNVQLPDGINLDPPAWFDIKAGAGQVNLSWAEVSSAQSYNLYRGQGIQDSVLYFPIANVPASQTTYADTSVSRNFSYYYYVTAVDDKGVESTKYLTRSRIAVTPYAAAGQTLDEVRVVPNPFVYDDQGNYFPDVDRITFAGLPGPSKITIFTLTGDIVDEINHTINSGSAIWNTSSKFNQYLASGVYFYHVESLEGKGSTTGKFIVIR
jgi:hypothetical protein